VLKPAMCRTECAICLDVIQDAAVTDCNHAFCFECVNGLLQQAERSRQVWCVRGRLMLCVFVTLPQVCPLCRRLISASDIRRIKMDAATGACVLRV
jgi:hypothetical protein